MYQAQMGWIENRDLGGRLQHLLSRGRARCPFNRASCSRPPAPFFESQERYVNLYKILYRYHWCDDCFVQSLASARQGPSSHHTEDKMDNNGSPPPISRHSTFYYPDGNICLVTPNNTVFRLLKSQLAHHSALFNDLFDLSAPSSDEDTYDGAAIVRVSDSPEDLALLFTLLWNGP